MKKIYLIDANNFIYRMFYWVPEFVTKKGEYVNAIFGIARFFLEQLTRENPDYIFFVKDAKGKNFRHDLDENYKATRDKMPDNLRTQIPIIEDMVNKMWVPIIQIPWFEADDVIWTLAKKYEWNPGFEIDILTWDKDLYSLVSNNIYIYDTMKKKRYSVKETQEKFWVKPAMIIDYLSIVWDKADNIPWIDWFWPKKAISLINWIWTIESIYEILDDWNFDNLDDEIKKIFKWKSLEKLSKSRENAFLSKKLASIVFNVELKNFDLKNYKFKPELYLNEDVKILFRELEFNSLLWEEAPKLKKWSDLWLQVKIIWDDLKLEKLFSRIKNYKKIVLDTETTSLNTMIAKLVWISIYLDDDNIFYINRMHNFSKVSDEKLKKFLKKLFDLEILIVGHNIKYDLKIIEIFLSSSNISDKQDDIWQMNLNF